MIFVINQLFILLQLFNLFLKEIDRLQTTESESLKSFPIQGSLNRPATISNPAPRFGKTDGMVLACVSLWAFNVPLVKYCLQFLAPVQTSLLRFATGGLIFVVYVLWREGSLKVAWRHVPLLVGAGIVGIMLNQLFFTYALKNTSSSEVSLLMAASPSFATLLAWLVGQEKISLNYWLSLPLAVAGVTVIILTAPGAQLGGNLLGDGLAIATAASWATYTVMIRPLMKHYSPSRVSAYVLLIGAIALLPFGIGQFDMNRLVTLPFSAWAALIYSALLAVVLTNVLWFTGIRDLGAPRTAFYAYLQPFLGVFAAALILNEQIVPWQIGGGFLVIGSMVLYRLRLGQKAEPVTLE